MCMCTSMSLCVWWALGDWGFQSCGWHGVWVGSITGIMAPKGNSSATLASVRTHSTHNIQMPSPAPPSCTSRSEVTLICQEAEGGQIYNDSREQHQVTTVNIYTGLTKDVAKVCGGSKHCRNYNQPQIINHLKITQWHWKVGFLAALSWLQQEESDALVKHPAVCACMCLRLMEC